MQEYDDNDLDHLNRIFNASNMQKRQKAKAWCNCQAKSEISYTVYEVSLNGEGRCLMCDYEVIWSVNKPRGS